VDAVGEQDEYGEVSCCNLEDFEEFEAEVTVGAEDDY